jgi:hypothetical protein
MHLSVASPHDQPVPEIARALRPGGRVSVTVTVPDVGPVPPFVTVRVYVAPLCPCVNDPACAFAIVRSATPGTRIVVESLEVSFAVFVWPPPETVAALMSGDDADAETFTVSVTGGYEADDASTSLRVQERGVRLQLHPAPESAVALNPEGRESVSVTVPDVGPVPTFDTAIVYVAPLWPRVNEPVWLFATVRSGTGPADPALNAATAAAHACALPIVADAEIGPAAAWTWS